jgi:GDP-4-dehydro-6-deoxy-D-mannose reductase
MRVVIARAFSHTGPDRVRVRARVVARQIAGHEARAARGEPGPYRLEVGNLEPVRDYSDVRDVVRAYLLLLEKGAPGEAYNVASGRGLALREALALLRAQSRVPIEVVESGALLRPADLSYLVGDATRLKALGWSPRHEIEETLLALLDGARRETGAPVQGGA